ncbi:LOW QUALITY PROTEIN: pentatricopeptide repeat-containing protein At5g04780, mitochondrial-like [Macadamia integrifolia]|uniref:LOW QUALITY PROTEIN: pentatricopeptide repeat-containing protein At5g04780, mitochondrial-like n=1 Tax=Macadamia integrifolia TaxID=60698 RepID=UPI001C4F59CD|nr:LOW QUALITY PROTEIN: pentatricopeptide repeat-containing protein At5g04780, mitochondrial-like [Macadamia integrifolia]
MRTLQRKYRELCNSISFYPRCFSIFLQGESEMTYPASLICVSTNGYELFSLHNLLQRCARNKAAKEGKICHGRVVLYGLGENILTSNILINMYSKCGLLESACQIFARMPKRSPVSWNTIIGAHTQHGEEEEALKLFMLMLKGGNPPSEFTLSSILCACAAKLAVCESKQLHAFALKTAMNSNVFVGTAVLDVYAKCNLTEDARLVFDTMSERSGVTWSSMVAGYVQNDLYEEALILFHRAQKMGLERSQFTLSAAVSACASLAAVIEGSQLHAVLVRTGFVSNLFVAASLIDMYAKCGSIEEAYFVFASMEGKNVVLWNAMISGFARHARFMEVMILFEKMQQMGIYPNEITYVSILSVCSHVGLIERGQIYFDLMNGDPSVESNVHHYSCMVDLLGRAGMIHEAWDLIETMPLKASASMWGSLLSSCRNHGNYELAEIAAKHLFEIEPHNAGNHVLLSNVYAANKRWDEVARSRKLLKDSGVKKVMGKSWIEVKGRVHTFMVGDRSHLRIDDIFAKLEDLADEMKKLDYMAETEQDLHDVEEDQKKELLRHHSEKLALAFALISFPPGTHIVIKKNLRICRDCHSFMKLASRIARRKIIVRDTNRFHHFRDGSCSCGDFW